MPPPRSPPSRRPPPRPTRPNATPGPRAGTAAPAIRPVSDAERDELQEILDRIPAPLEPLDVSMLDGFLCGVLVQPSALPASGWLPHVADVDGRPLPSGFDRRRLEALILRRHAELDEAISRRRWFDPWVYELAEDDAPPPSPPASARDGRPDAGTGPTANDGDEDDDRFEGDDDLPPPVDAVYPWVAGFATALELFPALARGDAQALHEPLALLYRHLAPDDLEDADDLLETIATLEPPADLADAVEGLVRATLLLADIGRPLAAAPKAALHRPHRPGRPDRPTR